MVQCMCVTYKLTRVSGHVMGVTYKLIRVSCHGVNVT